MIKTHLIINQKVLLVLELATDTHKKFSQLWQPEKMTLFLKIFTW